MKERILLFCLIGMLAGPAVSAMQPRINLGMMATDNLLSTQNREKYTEILVVNPGLRFEFGRPTLKFSIDLDLEAGRYTKSHDDDYEDATILGNVTYQPTSRIRFDARARQHWGHDERGSGRTEGGVDIDGTKPDEYTQRDIGGEFTYGAKEAKGRLILSADHLDREYTNNRLATRGLDHDETGLGATFKWRVWPKTSVLVEARYRDFDYDFIPAGSATLDSEEQRYFIGAEWEATYKTTGSIRIGRFNKEFDAASREDESGGAWEIATEWRPRSYSTVNLSTGRTTGESTGTGDVTVTDYYRASWTHAWVKRLSTTLSYSYEEAEHPGDINRREDETDTYRAEAKYKMRRWLDLSAGFEHINRDSNINAIEYDRNNLFLNASARF